VPSATHELQRRDGRRGKECVERLDPSVHTEQAYDGAESRVLSGLSIDDRVAVQACPFGDLGHAQVLLKPIRSEAAPQLA
jgi:hypothetical protein